MAAPVSYLYHLISLSYLRPTKFQAVTMNKVRLTILCCFYLITFKSNAQVNTDTTVNPMAIVDTALRIKNMNPYFNLHVDSSLAYQLIINKPQENYYWFINRKTIIGLLKIRRPV